LVDHRPHFSAEGIERKRLDQHVHAGVQKVAPDRRMTRRILNVAVAEIGLNRTRIVTITSAAALRP
jgi:hypothetical protein